MAGRAAVEKALEIASPGAASDRSAAAFLKALFEQGVLTKDEHLRKLESLVL